MINIHYVMKNFCVTILMTVISFVTSSMGDLINKALLQWGWEKVANILQMHFFYENYSIWIEIVADALAPNMCHATSNHHGDLAAPMVWL